MLPEADVAELPHVLVVDDSRVVRISLINHLKGTYSVREEADGEAAWQTLVLDHSIRAVISDLQMPKLNGYELLERLRTSKLRRLQNMPFILVSGEESEEERAKASALGVSDFVTKGVGSAEILRRLNNLMALSDAQEHIEAAREQQVQDPDSGLFSRKFLEVQIAQALAHSARHGVETSVMVLGFDGFSNLCERFGTSVADQVAGRFAKMLASKIRQEDSIGHFGAGQYAIIAPSTAASYCATFGERVREAIELARLTVQGEMVTLTVSIGLASVPADQVASALALLDVAGARMQQAMESGGNRLESGGTVPQLRPISLRHALELLATDRPETVIPHLPALGAQLMPLLELMGKELGLALPLAELERRLSERSSAKK